MVISTRKVFLIAVLCFTSSFGFAQTSSLCPEIPGGDQLTIDGVGTIQAKSLDSENGITKFINGCVEQGGWALEAPVLLLDEATNTLTAENAIIRARGAKGTVQKVSIQADITNLETVVLNLDASFDQLGLPKGRYSIRAASGSIQNQGLTLTDTTIDKLGAGNKIEQRFKAQKAVLKNNTLTVSNFQNATNTLLINASQASIQNGSITAQTISGSFGRVPLNSDVTFTAKNALGTGTGTLTLQDADIKVFGIPIGVQSITYDPNNPLEIPLVFSISNGLTIGLSGWRVLSGETGRLTIIGNNLFWATIVNPSLTLFLSGTVEGWKYLVGQQATGSFLLFVDRDPNIGFTFGANFDSGRRLGISSVTRASGDERVGYALADNTKTDFGLFTYRAKLELGHVWQDSATPATAPLGLTQSEVFVRFMPTLAWSKSIDNFGFTASVGANLYAYPFKQPEAAFVANANAGFTASYALKIDKQSWGSISSGIAWVENFGTNFIVRYGVTPATTLSLGLTFTPPIGSATPSLGYQGLVVSNPKITLGAVIDLRKVANSPQPFTSQTITATIKLDLYDGKVDLDNFGQPFQTPKISFTPSVSYNFIPQTGVFGSSITVYSTSFGFVFGTYLIVQNPSLSIPNPALGFSFSFALNLR